MDTLITALSWLSLIVTYWLLGRVVAHALSSFFGCGGSRLELDPAESFAATVWWPFVLVAIACLAVAIVTAHAFSPKPWARRDARRDRGDLG